VPDIEITIQKPGFLTMMNFFDFNCQRRLHPSLAFALLLFVAGACGKKSDLPATGPVEGKVTLNGQPLKSGTVVFVPDAGGKSAQGNIDSDGTFVLGTFTETDGAILGTHKVMITAMEEAGGSGLPEDNRTDPNVGLKSLIPAHYGNLEKSGLTATVKEGDNEINFELTDAKPAR
jgi:hypothetical protein